MSLDLPETIGPYRVLRCLGRGGMGEVFLAHDPRLDRQVAIKRVRSDSRNSDSWHARFAREAKLLAKLTHANIVPIYDLVTEENGTENIVMEYVQGMSLEQILSSHGPPEIERSLKIAVEIARGLVHAHAEGVIHRDLKTENVLIGPLGKVKISDFGTARQLLLASEEESEALTRDGAVLGTLRAMSPEQVQGESVDARSDLFAFGVLLYELFTGISPFKLDHPVATAARIRDFRQPAANRVDSRVPPGVASLIDHLLEKEQVLRPRDAEEVLERLLVLAGQSALDGDETLDINPREPVSPVAPISPVLAGTSSATGQRPRSRAPVLGLAVTVVTVVTVVLVGATALVIWPSLEMPSLAGFSRPVPRHVVVLGPKLEGQRDERSEAMAFVVRSAASKLLSTLEGVFPASRAEVEGTAGSPREIAYAVAAEEIVEPTLRCLSQTCQLQLEVIDADSGRLRWSDHAEIPIDEPLVAARAVEVLLRNAYPGRRALGNLDLEVDRRDFAAFLEIKRALDSAPSTPELESGLERLEVIAERSPAFLDARLLAAEVALRLHIESGDPSRLELALELGESAEALAPSNPQVLFRRARLEIADNRLDAAEATLARLDSLVPADPELLYHRTEILFIRGELRQALDLARRTAERHRSWRYLYRYAAIASRAGETDLAREVLGRLLERSPRNTDGRELLARIEMIGGRLERAAALYEELVAESPGLTELGNLGNLKMLLGQPAAAAEIFERLLAASPDDPRSALNLADARALAGETEVAQRIYQRVLLDLARQPPALASQQLTVKAQALVHLDRKKEAVAAIQEALREAPQDAHVAYEAALVFAVAGDYNSALVSFSEAIELGFSPIWFRYPWFDPLRDDQQFEYQVWAGAESS